MYNPQQSLTESQMSLQDPNRKMKLKPLKWEKPLKKGKTKTQIFIWGKARPPSVCILYYMCYVTIRKFA